MRKTKHFLLMAAMLLCHSTVRGYDFTSTQNNVRFFFNITSTAANPLTVAVTYSTAGYATYSGAIVIPETVMHNGYNYRVTSIGQQAFQDCSITSVIIPQNVTTIAYNAFAGCKSLTSISIPKNVTVIGSSAFSYCSNLADLTLHSNPSISAHAIPSATKVTLVLNDGEAADFNAANANTYDRVVYNRELGAGKYGTIMLPFAPDAESMENFAFYSLSSVDGETLIFDEVATPVANTPYLYALREGKSVTQITGGETTIASAIATPEIDGWKTVGSFINQTVDCSAGDACYYAINAADNMLYNVVSKMHVKPSRAYFKSSANVSQLCIRTRDGGETLIDAVKVSDFTPTVYYDLSGRRVENPTEGIYIVNGKKVIL